MIRINVHHAKNVSKHVQNTLLSLSLMMLRLRLNVKILNLVKMLRLSAALAVSAAEFAQGLHRMNLHWKESLHTLFIAMISISKKLKWRQQNALQNVSL